jgi:hypothetical protein
MCRVPLKRGLAVQLRRDVQGTLEERQQAEGRAWLVTAPSRDARELLGVVPIANGKNASCDFTGHEVAVGMQDVLPLCLATDTAPLQSEMERQQHLVSVCQGSERTMTPRFDGYAEAAEGGDQAYVLELLWLLATGTADDINFSQATLPVKGNRAGKRRLVGDHGKLKVKVRFVIISLADSCREFVLHVKHRLVIVRTFGQMHPTVNATSRAALFLGGVRIRHIFLNLAGVSEVRKCSAMFAEASSLARSSASRNQSLLRPVAQHTRLQPKNRMCVQAVEPQVFCH